MKNVLILSDINFWEGSSGHRARLKAIIGYLSHKVTLTVVNTGPAPDGIEASLGKTYPAEFHILEKKKIMSSNGYCKRLEKLMGDREFDTVIIEYIHSSYFLNALNGEPKIILDMHDIISERAMEFKKFNYAGQLYELNAETELAMLEVYDHVIAICIPDKEKLDGMLDPAKVLLCPHPVEQVSHSLREQVQYIVFVASAYLPNRDGINHFIRECWPIVSAKFPHVLLTIYGTVCAWVDLAGNQNISLKGFVPDLANIYESADIAINPVRFGAGMKIKNIEALANGIPLVTTMHGARGLESITDKGFLVANGFSEFTEILLSMIGDLNLRQTLSDNGRKFVEQYFSVENCFNPLLQIIENN